MRTLEPVDTLPTWRGRLHVWAFWASLPASAVLLSRAEGALEHLASGVYGAGLVGLFGVSAAYHRLARSFRARALLRRLDHSMIYVFIAATYTPVCLLALPRSWGLPVLAVVWTGAAAGVVLKLTGAGRVTVLGHCLYLVLGWLLVLAAPAVVAHLGAVEVALLAGGGAVYTAGAVVLLRRRPNPWPRVFGYHEAWHACTVVAGGAHFAAVTLLL